MERASRGFAKKSQFVRTPRLYTELHIYELQVDSNREYTNRVQLSFEYLLLKTRVHLYCYYRLTNKRNLSRTLHHHHHYYYYYYIFIRFVNASLPPRPSITRRPPRFCFTFTKPNNTYVSSGARTCSTPNLVYVTWAILVPKFFFSPFPLPPSSLPFLSATDFHRRSVYILFVPATKFTTHYPVLLFFQHHQSRGVKGIISKARCTHNN